MTTSGPEHDTDETPDPDAAVPAHHGDPPAEQRAMARSAAVVDRIVRASRQDLDTVPVAALPELVERLARQRLIDTAAPRH